MPLYRLLQERVFEPEMVAAMGEAYERALTKLQLKGRNDPLTRLVAERVIAAVESGTRDADQLYELIVSEFLTKHDG